MASNVEEDYSKKFFIISTILTPALWPASALFSTCKASYDYQEPIQSCESWIRSSIRLGELSNAQMKLSTMLIDMAHPFHTTAHSVGFRPEDLKVRTKHTLSKISKFLDINPEQDVAVNCSRADLVGRPDKC